MLNRDVLQADEAIHGLQASETAMRENRVMFSIVMFKKVLNLVQQARLAATSFPLLPCVKTVSPAQTYSYYVPLPPLLFITDLLGACFVVSLMPMCDVSLRYSSWPSW
jgi:hypothetical protein